MKKNNNITELVFILDRSGSMSGLESDTIGGFNAMIEKQKKQNDPCYVSTVLFNDVSEVLYDRVKLGDVQKMLEAHYCVGGCTALMDAIGVAKEKEVYRSEGRTLGLLAFFTICSYNHMKINQSMYK